MNNLEDHIRNNRKLYDEDEPNNGHLERFINRLDAREKQTKKRSISRSMLAVAAILLLGLILTPVYLFFQDQAETAAPGKGAVELSTIESFYKTQANNYLQQIDQLADRGIVNPAQKAEALKRVEELEMKNKLLSAQYAQLGGDSRLKTAIIRNYQMMSESLNTLIVMTRNTRNYIPEQL